MDENVSLTFGTARNHGATANSWQTTSGYNQFGRPNRYDANRFDGGGGGNNNILQGNTNTTLALLTIASSTISTTVASIVNHMDDGGGNHATAALIATNSEPDYSYDPFDNYKRIHQNVSSIERTLPLPTANDLTGDNVSRNLLNVTAVNAFNAIMSSSTTILTQFNATQSTDIDVESTPSPTIEEQDNYWALFALVLVLGTAAGNILVCLAIAWERRLQNVTNYFLMSLAITDLMVAILVMPLGILTLYKGYFPLESVHCLAWICLDVLFCTASIMHLCTISIDRYLSLRYPMRFGRNKTRKRVTVKIIFVWLLSIAMSLPLSLMYSKDHGHSVLVDGTCQIPDPVYKLVGSIVCFYIPLAVMLITYCWTVRLLARQHQSLCGGGNGNGNGGPIAGIGSAPGTGATVTNAPNGNPNGWSSGWLGQQPLERRCTWRRLLRTSLPSTPNHPHSATSTDTELSTLDTHELWLPDSSIPEPTPSTMTALHQFGAEMLKLSRGLDAVSSIVAPMSTSSSATCVADSDHASTELAMQQTPLLSHRTIQPPRLTRERNRPISPQRRNESKRRASHSTWSTTLERNDSQYSVPGLRKRFNSLPRIEQVDADSNKFGDVECESECDEDGEPVETEQMKNSKNRRNISERIKAQPCIHDRQPQQHKSMHHHVQAKSGTNLNEIILPPPCTCPYFGSKSHQLRPAEVKIVSSLNLHELSPLIPTSNQIPVTACTSSTGTTTFVTSPSAAAAAAACAITMRNSAPSLNLLTAPSNHSIATNSSSVTPATSPQNPMRKLSFSTTPHVKSNSVVTWDTRRTQKSRRGSSFGSHQTQLLINSSKVPQLTSALRRSATLRNNNQLINGMNSANLSGAQSIDSNILSANTKTNTMKSAQSLFARAATVRSHHSRNSSVISRNSSRHGRIIRLEQKATKVLGVVFFTFVILWAPFFVLNLLPTICGDCEQKISHWVFDVVTWLGYASSMVNPIFYTIFNKVFRQAFKKVLMCQYGETKWRPQR